MREIGLFEAKNKFSALVARVEKGEEVVITRRGLAVARIVPERKAYNQKAALAAVARIREMRKGVTLGGLKIKDLINEGRKY